MSASFPGPCGQSLLAPRSTRAHRGRAAPQSPPKWVALAPANAPATAPAAATALPAGQDEPHVVQAGEDFFLMDVVEYGNRYNRPDRFPRPKQADKSRRVVDVGQWLARVAGLAAQCGFSGHVAPPDCKQQVFGAGAAAKARDMSMLVRQGRLEEALREMEGWGSAGAEGGEPSGVLDHGQVMLAAVDAGDVALAFEYAGLLPASADTYNFLMAAYVVRGDVDAVGLARSTASRRGIEPNALTFLLEAAGAAVCGDKDKAQAVIAEAKNAGLCEGTLGDECWSSLCSL